MSKGKKQEVPIIRKRNLVSDTVFKYFIKSEEFRSWFYEIIKAKTGIDLNEYELYDNEENSGNAFKDFRMNSVFKNANKKVIVEMNNGNPEESELKMYFYLHRVQGNSIKEGEGYKKFTTTLIAFNNYKNPEVPDLAIGYYRMTEQSTGILKENDVQSYEISLPLFHKTRYNEITDKIDRRLWLLGVGDMEEARKALDLSDENIKIIKEYERLIKEDERFAYVYDVEEENKKWIRSAHSLGYDEGIEQGEKQKAVETAKKLLSKLSIEEISDITGLSLEEIEKLES